jgi:hypothetical protein
MKIEFFEVGTNVKTFTHRKYALGTLEPIGYLIGMKGKLFTYRDKRNLFLKPIGEVSLEIIESLSFYAENASGLKEFLYIDFSDCSRVNMTFKAALYKLSMHASENSIKVTFANTCLQLDKDLEAPGLKTIVDFKNMDLSMIPWEEQQS